MKSIKTLLTLLILGISVLAATSCRQTMRGAGEDIENAGEKIQNTAN